MAGLLLRSASRLRLLLLLPSRGARSVAFSPAPLPVSSRAASSISRRHLIYQARFSTVAPQEKGDAQEQLPTPVRVKQEKHFDWALNKLDESIKRTGRITKNLLLNVFHNTCRAGCPSGNLALLFLRGCGSLLPELPPSQRTELAHSLWTKLENLGVVYDVSHYNALLKVYLQNEHEFSPVEFLTKMEEANVQPNRVTYQRLIAAYCNKGDIEGASKILGFMKSKELPITESVFNSLVTGHARSGDMESAENIFSVMKNAGVVPGPETYIALLKAYAEKGDLTKIEETLGNIEKADASIFDRDLMDIIFVLAKAGYPQYVQNILEKMRYDRGYVPDAMNFCLALITEGLEDTAFQVLKTLRPSSLDSREGVAMDQGNFFLRHCVNMDKPLAKLKHFCAELKEANMHHAPLQFALLCALESKKDDLAVGLMKAMKEEGLPVKVHYFWPLLAWHQKNKNVQGTFEVLKTMHEMEVKPDGETYLKFVLSNFEENTARNRFQEVGCPIENTAFCVAEITQAALNGKLDKVLAILSSADTPPLDLHQFKNSLISGFRRSNFVEACSKITELLYKDGRYCQTPPGAAEAVGYFLYNLIDSMSDSEVQAKEEQLRQYFHQLNKMNIEIPFNIFGSIRRLLNKDRVPELIKDVIQLTDEKRLSEGTRFRFSGLQVSTLEETLEQLKAEGKPVKDVLKQLILALCSEENLQKALEIKAKYEVDMVVGGYLALISLCCRHNNAEEAMNLKDELAQKDSSVVLDANRYISLVRALSKDGRMEDAINVLKEMKEKDVLTNDTTATAFFHLLNAAALQKQVEMVNRLHETLVTLDLVKNTGNLCSTLITVHLEKDDLPAAVEALFDCHKKYKQLPRRHDILCKLIEKGDTELLHKVMDFLTTARGEMTMVYDLFFAFLQTGKYKEAKKIIETPGLRAQPNRLQWFAERCVFHNQVEALENMVEMTEKLFECDRDEMYYYLLQSYKESNDWQKVDSAWTKMQEENVIPRERTLRLIADILKTNNQEVPFDIPKTWYEEDTNESMPSELASSVENKIFRLCKSRRPEEAYDVLQDAEKNNIVFLPNVYDTVIKALLSKSCLEEALEVKNIAKTHIKGFVLNDAANSLLIITQARRDYLKDAISTLESLLKMQQMPSKLAVTRLVQILGQKGDLESIRTVEEMTKNLSSFIKLSGMLFINNTLLAHINNNNLDGAIAYIEPMFTSGDLHSDLPKHSIAYVFRNLLENKMEPALERLSAMAERLAHQFGIYRPVTDLFLEYISAERVEDARLLLERCSVISEQKKMLNAFLAKTTKKSGQTHKVETLVNLIPDMPLRTLSSYLMKAYALDKNVASAKALYEKMETEKVQPDELFLKRLAVLLKNAGEPVPFTEPPESFKFYADKLRAEHEELSSDED